MSKDHGLFGPLLKGLTGPERGPVRAAPGSAMPADWTELDYWSRGRKRRRASCGPCVVRRDRQAT